jgi:hypothetical protein
MDNRLSDFATWTTSQTGKRPKMTTKKVSAGQMWKSEQTGEVFVVTSLYKDVLASFAMLRAIHSSSTENNKRAKVVKIEGVGECIVGFSIAEQV